MTPRRNVPSSRPKTKGSRLARTAAKQVKSKGRDKTAPQRKITDKRRGL